MTTRALGSYCLIIAALLVPRAALAQRARLQLDHLDKLAEKATDTVDVRKATLGKIRWCTDLFEA